MGALLPNTAEFDATLELAERRLDTGQPLTRVQARALVERSLVRLMRSARPQYVSKATDDLAKLHKLYPKPRKPRPRAVEVPPPVPPPVAPEAESAPRRPTRTELNGRLGL